MASIRAGTLNEGTLYETVARGNKDNYFISKTFKDAINPFETRYLRRPGFVNELRRTGPLNGPDFGRSCEFEFEMVGDLFQEVAVLIDLPTWLPPVEAALNTDWNYLIQAAVGTSYGYTRGIAYFLFSNIQIFQDKILLQEFSGDALWASQLSRGSLNSSWLTDALVGQTGFDQDTTDLSRLATPGRLRLQIPMLAGDQGLPSSSMRQQKFRLKLTLRTLEDCVECTDSTIGRPAPWTLPALQVSNRANPALNYTIAPLPREKIGRPIITLETRHTYLDPESREAVQKAHHEIPYSILYESAYTFTGAADIYTSVNLDGSHPASRIFWIFRTKDNLQRNRRYATSSSTTPASSLANPYYATLSFNIAGKVREDTAAPIIWNTLVPFCKEERDPGFQVGEMNWDLGFGPGRESPFKRVPEGSINFSTAEKPAFLYLMRSPSVGDTFTTKTLELMIVVESWTLFKIENERGYTAFSN